MPRTRWRWRSSSIAGSASSTSRRWWRKRCRVLRRARRGGAGRGPRPRRRGAGRGGADRRPPRRRLRRCAAPDHAEPAPATGRLEDRALELLGNLWNMLPSLPRTLIAFAVVLGVLVFIHELGHYLAARWRGVHVEALLDRLRPAHPEGHRPARHGMAARLDPARRLREDAWAGDAGGRARPRCAPPGRRGGPSTASRSAAAPSWWRPGRSPTSCLPSCCSPGCS